MAGQQFDIRTLLSVEADDKGVQEARRALHAIVEEQADLTRKFKAGDSTVSAYNKEMAKLVKTEKGLKTALDGATNEISLQQKALKEAVKASQELSRQQKELGTSQGRIDATRRSVSGAGDFEGSVRTVGGALQAFGAPAGVGRAFSGAGEIGALVEALPTLKASLREMPNFVSAAAKSLGTSSTGLIGGLGVAGIAFAAITIAAKEFAKVMQEQAELVGFIISSQRDVGQQIAGGLTSESAKERAGNLEKLLADEEERVQRLTRIYEKHFGKADNVFAAIMERRLPELANFQETFARLFPQEGKFVEEINTSKENMESYRKELEALNRAIESGALDANDAAAAAAKLAEAREDSAESVEQVTKALGKAAQTQKKFGQTGLAFTASSIGLIGTNPAETAAKKKEAEEIAKQFRELEKDAAEREMDLRKEFSEKRFQLELSDFRTIEDLIKDAGRSRADALEAGNFLDLRNINKAEKRAAADQLTALRRGHTDINRAAEMSQRELQAQAATNMAQLNREVDKGLKQVVNQFSAALASIAGTSSAPRVPFGVSLFATAPRTS